MTIADTIVKIEGALAGANGHVTVSSELLTEALTQLRKLETAVPPIEPPFGLTRMEWRIYAHLAENRGRVVPPDALIAVSRIKSKTPLLRQRALWVHLHRLREKIEAHPEAGTITCSLGEGYVLYTETEGSA